MERVAERDAEGEREGGVEAGEDLAERASVLLQEVEKLVQVFDVVDPDHHR